MFFFRGGRRNMKICSYYPFPKSLSRERDLVAVLRNFLSKIFFKSKSNNYALFSGGATGRVLPFMLPDGAQKCLFRPFSGTDRQSFGHFIA